MRVSLLSSVWGWKSAIIQLLVSIVRAASFQFIGYFRVQRPCPFGELGCPANIRPARCGPEFLN